MREFKIKNIEADIVDLDEPQRIVKGFFSVFGNIDSQGERVIKGAYSKTIKENGPQGTGRIRHFLDHNTTKAVGKILELHEDEGLSFVSRLGQHTLGMDVFYMYQDGLIKEHSVGYDVIREQRAGDGVLELLELKLWEGSSLQGWGANELALTTAVKSMEQLEAIEELLRKSKMSDETIKNIELQLKVIKETLTPQKAPEPPVDYSEIYKSLNLKI